MFRKQNLHIRQLPQNQDDICLLFSRKKRHQFNFNNISYVTNVLIGIFNKSLKIHSPSALLGFDIAFTTILTHLHRNCFPFGVHQMVYFYLERNFKCFSQFFWIGDIYFIMMSNSTQHSKCLNHFWEILSSFFL